MAQSPSINISDIINATGTASTQLISSINAAARNQQLPISDSSQVRNDYSRSEQPSSLNKYFPFAIVGLIGIYFLAKR